jgi:hypothetical protein
MMKITNMLSAKAIAYASTVRDSFTKKTEDESGDIVQTLIIIGIAVVLGGLLLAGLRPVVENCLNAISTGRGSCFGTVVS